MDTLLELGGLWLARAYAAYGIAFLVLPMLFFLHVVLFAALLWAAVAHARGHRPWPFVPDGVRNWARLVLELTFGLVNPIIQPWLDDLFSSARLVRNAC